MITLPIGLCWPSVKLERIDDYQSWRFWAGDLRVVVDPWLTPRFEIGPKGIILSREHGDAPEHAPERPPECDLLVLTAPFADHFNPETLRGFDRGTPVLASGPAARRMRRLGFSKVEVFRPDRTLDMAGAEIRGVRSGFPYGGNSSGFVLREKSSGRSLYFEPHVVDPRREELPDEVDAIVMPVERVRLLGVPFAMGPVRAAAAAARVNARFIVPTGTHPERNEGLLARFLLRIDGGLEDLRRGLDALERGASELLALPSNALRELG